jgi:hypothetical protein
MSSTFVKFVSHHLDPIKLPKWIRYKTKIIFSLMQHTKPHKGISTLGATGSVNMPSYWTLSKFTYYLIYYKLSFYYDNVAVLGCDAM